MKGIKEIICTAAGIVGSSERGNRSAEGRPGSAGRRY